MHVNNPDDRELREQVTTHLKAIAEQFARGDFRAPFAVHSEKPDGVPALAQFSRDIVYTFVPDETGGKVSISTGSKKALAGAMNEFLRSSLAADNPQAHYHSRSRSASLRRRGPPALRGRTPSRPVSRPPGAQRAIAPSHPRLFEATELDGANHA